MKKTVAVSLVLLLLAAMIGLENFRAKHLVEAKEVAQTVSEDSSPRRRPQLRTSSTEAVETIIPVESGAEQALETVPEALDPALQRIPLNTSGSMVEGRNPRILFIRSLTILKSSKPDKQSIVLLRLAVWEVSAGFESQVMIVDLDGLVTSNSPFVVYAHPRFDVTAAVQAEYKVLNKDSARLSKSRKVEQPTIDNGGKLPD